MEPSLACANTTVIRPPVDNSFSESQELPNNKINSFVNEKDFSIALQEFQEKFRQSLSACHDFQTVCGNRTSCVFTADTEQSILNAIRTFDGVGKIFASRGFFKESQKCHERGLELKKQYLPLDSAELASSWNYFADLYRLKGNYTEALRKYAQSLDILEGRMNVEGKFILEECTEQNNRLLQFSQAYYGLGVINTLFGKYTDAQKYLDDALEIRSKIFSECDLEVVEIYQAMGRLYLARGLFEEALEILNKAFSIVCKVYGEKHYETAKISSDLGIVLVKAYKYDEAMIKIKQGLDILIQKYGNTHPEVAKGYIALGVIYRVHGNFKEARESFLKSLEIRKKIYEESHESIGEAYSEIGSTYIMQGLYKDAEQYYWKSCEMYLGIFGKSHPATALAYANLKATYAYSYKENLHEHDNVDELVNELEGAQNTQQAFLGNDHFDLCFTYIIRGNVFRYLKRVVLAIECYNKALDIASKKKDIYISAYIHRYLAFAYKTNGSSSQSLYHSNKGLKLWSKLPASIRPQAFADPDFFAHVIFNFNDIISAEKYMKKTNQLVSASKDEEWTNFARSALKAFQKKEAKNKVMYDDAF